MEGHEITRRVMKDGIVNVYGKPFYDDRLLAYVGEMVKVSADINDLRSVTIYDKRGKVICEALEA